MVQYVFTPWRDRQELLLVRQQFYPAAGPASASAPSSSAPYPSSLARQSAHADDARPGANDDAVAPPPPASGHGQGNPRIEQQQQQQQQQQDQQTRSQRWLDQHQAVARVSMWMQRGHCPHMVESTALLTAAILSDEQVDVAAAEHTAASSTYAIRAAYSAAFSRFVTGLLDGHQDKQRKQSMYSIARTIGLPAAFVELRHQSTHEQLPSRAKLRSAAKQALAWIWDYYWRHLPGVVHESAWALASNDVSKDACSQAVLRYLRRNDEAGREELRQWSREQLLEATAAVRSGLAGNQAYLKCMRLTQELLAEKSDDAEGALRMGDVKVPHENAQAQAASGADVESAETSIEHDAAPKDTAEHDTADVDAGWTMYAEPWKPKPIGIV